jgi:MoxR-like ATPase
MGGRPAVGGTRPAEANSGILRREPHRPLDGLYLSKSVRARCNELIEEQLRADVLRANGLEPRHRLLLIGPPGNGKTSLAEAIAYQLALPWFTVR